MRVAVIGCGIFGAAVAARLVADKHDVHIFEREAEPLRGATACNQRRLHLGFHYPRDMETARACARGHARFQEAFSDCVVRVEPNAYFIAHRTDSLTTTAAYRDFIKHLDVPHQPADTRDFRPAVRNVEAGFLVPETIYDVDRLRASAARSLSGARGHFGTEVTDVARCGTRFKVLFSGGSLRTDAVVNCTYSDVNRFNEHLRHPLQTYQYERTAVAVIAWDQPPVGITVLDGDFGVTVLPATGSANRFLLYHVAHSVIAREIGTQTPASWQSAPPEPSARLFADMREACAHFVPALASARLVEFLTTTRAVLADRDATDARPSIVICPEKNFFRVLAGKVDHCVDVADEVAHRLQNGVT